MKVLVADAEPAAAERLASLLATRWADVEVRSAASGADALARFRAEQFDLVVLDVRLPDLDGLRVCRSIRSVSDVPIVFVASRLRATDRVRGLEGGADDFLTKPWEDQELLARLQAVLRRAGQRRREDGFRPDFDLGHVQIDLTRREVRVNGRPVRLTPIEYRLLCRFLEHPGQVLTPEVLVARVWGEDHPDRAELLKIHVQRLRRKLEDNPREARVIATERGIGYRLIRRDGVSSP